MEPAAPDAPVPPGSGPAPKSASRAADLVTAAVVFTLGLGALIGALDLGYWSRGPGPGFFPLWLGVLMLLAALWAGQVLRGRNLRSREPTAPGGRRDVALVLGALLVATLLLDVVGYQLAMTVHVLFVLLVAARRRVIESIAVAVVAGFGILVGPEEYTEWLTAREDVVAQVNEISKTDE